MPREVAAFNKYGSQPVEPWAEHSLKKASVAMMMAQYKAPYSGGFEAPAARPFRLPQPGDKVEVTGLRSRPDMNGAVARVASGSMDADGRVAVQLFAADGTDVVYKPVKIKVSSLRPLPSSVSLPSLPRAEVDMPPVEEPEPVRSRWPTLRSKTHDQGPSLEEKLTGPDRFKYLPSATVVKHPHVEGATLPKNYARLKFISWNYED
mmetsp:Transcript_7450/g.13212  ORF Transcript_7450/g.13212 Transcript_7450/m.13212 type:complete len:206 (-) Transcript_7450:51-668(-)|eukprot:CAMPEP_0197657378 /NCGR_PEP_ID=MMETSP1338-20131121/44590_1 /TAXON_ID=43686 ORGANISM="Pelagodinium beii, Strain RCC1491" /NCGR_SAMPLE_ID=MMETSP1338 /ASSEMBLY_ACC=CAM_ASM_000754 /LENGTH=205 /DNA_ID=CAMNT_0043233725 /DNA_START=56 /DNA_END=673 /DNA_ORIENTATION=+